MGRTKAEDAKITEAEAVANMLKRIQSDRAAHIEFLTRQMDFEDAAIDAAYRAIDAAKIAGNTEVYQRAKAMLEDAENALEMSKTRLNELKNRPLISPERYETVVTVLREEIATLEDPEAVRNANDVLHRLQQFEPSNYLKKE